ncbi:MAG: SSU ribosomal protein S15p (S13e), partial [uncultured Nocardioides sp.]
VDRYRRGDQEEDHRRARHDRGRHRFARGADRAAQPPHQPPHRAPQDPQARPPQPSRAPAPRGPAPSSAELPAEHRDPALPLDRREARPASL